jgi:thioredoxin-like negative regulator of GroEL
MSRAGCHLCEQVIEELVPLVRGRAHLEVVDIDTDPQLVAQYGLRVPVVVADDNDLSEFPLDRDAVSRFLSVFD